MKDHNSSDISGTVLESINASERLETRVLRYKKNSSCGFTEQMVLKDMDYLCFEAFMTGDSGVNPTHCTETGI